MHPTLENVFGEVLSQFAAEQCSLKEVVPSDPVKAHKGSALRLFQEVVLATFLNVNFFALWELALPAAAVRDLVAKLFCSS